jgi:hypothetical protein
MAGLWIAEIPAAFRQILSRELSPVPREAHR